MSNLNNTPRPVRKLKHTITICVIYEGITSEKEVPVEIKNSVFSSLPQEDTTSFKDMISYLER